MESALSGYLTLLLSGFLGSLGHCLGMCGPLVIMVGLRLKAARPAAVRLQVDSFASTSPASRPLAAPQLAAQQLAVLPYLALYHSARISVYAVFGALAGGLGSLLGVGANLSHLAGAASLIFGLGIVLLGLGYLGWLPLGRLEGGGNWLNRMLDRALKRGGSAGVASLGALNGLLPCGLVYSALLVAASGGSALRGALSMVSFGLGTVPALMIVGLGASALSSRVRHAFSLLAGILIAAIGLQLILRGLAALGAVPHLHLGRLVLW